MGTTPKTNEIWVQGPFVGSSVKTKLSSAEASGVLFGRSFGQNPSAENTRSSVLAEASVMTEGSVHDRRVDGFWGKNC